jgi:hypothetical protein
MFIFISYLHLISDWKRCIGAKFWCYHWKVCMWCVQCNLEFGCQLSICSGTEENQGEPLSIWPVAGPSGCKLTSSQQLKVKLKLLYDWRSVGRSVGRSVSQSVSQSVCLGVGHPFGAHDEILFFPFFCRKIALLSVLGRHFWGEGGPVICPEVSFLLPLMAGTIENTPLLISAS